MVVDASKVGCVPQGYQTERFGNVIGVVTVYSLDYYPLDYYYLVFATSRTRGVLIKTSSKLLRVKSPRSGMGQLEIALITTLHFPVKESLLVDTLQRVQYVREQMESHFGFDCEHFGPNFHLFANKLQRKSGKQSQLTRKHRNFCNYIHE